MLALNDEPPVDPVFSGAAAGPPGAVEGPAAAAVIGVGERMYLRPHSVRITPCRDPETPARQDRPAVIEAISIFAEKGLRVYSDQDLQPGEDWEKSLFSALGTVTRGVLRPRCHCP